VKELLPREPMPEVQGEEFRKETDILDVWFDSGVSYAAVCEKRPNLKSPPTCTSREATSTGMVPQLPSGSVGTRGQAPYHSVLTHGFVVDGEGRKMSKSLGNTIVPEEVIKRYGAEILRLWVAARTTGMISASPRRSSPASPTPTVESATPAVPPGEPV